jgi:hypothetical protein
MFYQLGIGPAPVFDQEPVPASWFQLVPKPQTNSLGLVRTGGGSAVPVQPPPLQCLKRALSGSGMKLTTVRARTRVTNEFLKPDQAVTDHESVAPRRDNIDVQHV